MRSYIHLVYPFLAILTLGACAAPEVPEVPDDWKPLNTYTQEIRKIPLQKPYAYTVLPIDGSLKCLLERWARDKKMQLHYNVRSDFTLPVSLNDFKKANLEESLAVLDKTYKAKGITIGLVDESKILVQPFVENIASAPTATQ